jgi:tellurite resistance protein
MLQIHYHVPSLRSKAVLRPHRAAGDDGPGGEAPQPISPPDIIPLQRGYWATYGKQTVACLACGLLALLFGWGFWYAGHRPHPKYENIVLTVEIHPDESKFLSSERFWEYWAEHQYEMTITTWTPPETAHDVDYIYCYLAFVVAGLVFLMPLFFVLRWRRLEQIFGNEMYDSDEGAPGEGDAERDADRDADQDAGGTGAPPSAALAPRPAQILDGTQVALSALLLGLTAAAQLVVGVVLLAAETPTAHIAGPALWKVFAGGLLLQAAVNTGLLVATLRHRVGASRLAFHVSLVGVALAALTVHWLPLVVCATVAAVLWRMDAAFRAMLARVATPEKPDALEAYYHNLLQLLVWVMRADGHCDRRELRKIRTTCDALRLSDWERDVVLASANLDSRQDLRDAAARYLDAAAAVGLADPGRSLLVVALAVAGADGVIAAEEADAVRELAKLVRVPADEAQRLLLQQQLHLEVLDATRALELLHLETGATPEQVLKAHGTLAAELQESRFQHLGTSLADLVRQRLAMLDRSRDLLLQPSA